MKVNLVPLALVPVTNREMDVKRYASFILLPLVNNELLVCGLKSVVHFHR